ncbi:hypothetical protein LIER_33370 [Lithospermum erythrorhizon]|uniref:Integrase zinc-binding domain-containing protein n=1 Tax=Lithospermum erythrorhizon TaxID=34254 RepID=A0AAV3RXX0_LITER
MYQEQLDRKILKGLLSYCVAAKDIPNTLYEIHERWSKSHIGRRSLALKIAWVRFLWPTLVKDATEYVKRCDAYQKLGVVSQQPATHLMPIFSPIPFSMWRIDLVGKFSKAKGDRVCGCCTGLFYKIG